MDADLDSAETGGGTGITVRGDGVCALSKAVRPACLRGRPPCGWQRRFAVSPGCRTTKRTLITYSGAIRMCRLLASGSTSTSISVHATGTAQRDAVDFDRPRPLCG